MGIQIFESYHQGAFRRENILTKHVLGWSGWWRNYWRLLMCCLDSAYVVLGSRTQSDIAIWAFHIWILSFDLEVAYDCVV